MAIFSQKLRIQRLQRGWSQARLAEQLGTTPNTVSMWERGQSIPTAYFREKLSMLFGLSMLDLLLLPGSDQTQGETNMERETEPALRAILPPAIQSAITSLADPLLSNSAKPLFLAGRDHLLQHIQRRLLQEPATRLLALHGLPGSGKTALVQKLLQAPAMKEHFPAGVLWAELGSRTDLSMHLKRWSVLLGLAPEETKEGSSMKELLEKVRVCIGEQRFLFVLDGLWHPEDTQILQAVGPNCACIVTTRFPLLAVQLAEHAGTIHVPQLTEQDGIAIFTHFVPDIVHEYPEVMHNLVNKVGGLPLAIVCIAKHLQTLSYFKQPRRIRQALALLQHPNQRFELQIPLSLNNASIRSTRDTLQSLGTYIAGSVQHLSSQAKRTLCTLSMLPTKYTGFSEESVQSFGVNIEETIDELFDAGLLESNLDGLYTLHPIIADYTRLYLRQLENIRQPGGSLHTPIPTYNRSSGSEPLNRVYNRTPYIIHF